MFRERKLHDMTLRLDGLYDIIVELEEKIEDVKLRRKAVEQDAITLENIYTLLANFDKVYDKISDEEKKSLISSLIKEIEIFPCDEAELPLKSILFNFPVYKDGGDVCGFLWDKSTHVSTWHDTLIMMSPFMWSHHLFVETYRTTFEFVEKYPLLQIMLPTCAQTATCTFLCLWKQIHITLSSYIIASRSIYNATFLPDA